MAIIISKTREEREGDLLTNQISQVDVVTLAVFLEGGDQKSIDTEDVAMRAHTIAPGRFAWRKYPDQVNLELIRVYLSDAKKPEKGALLHGSGRTGWSLTPAGLAWAQTASRTLLDQNLSRASTESGGGSIDGRRADRERARVQATGAWKQWAAGDRERISHKAAAEVFRIDSYAEGRLRTMKLTRLNSLFAGDTEIFPFLQAMAKLLESEG